jgi:hypothetical protein
MTWDNFIDLKDGIKGLGFRDSMTWDNFIDLKDGIKGLGFRV